MGDQDVKKDQQSGEEKAPKIEEALEALVSEVESLKEKVEDRAGSEALTIEELQALLENMEQGTEEIEKQEEKETDNKGLAELQALKKQVEAQITYLQQELLKMRVIQEVEACRKKYSDFDNYEKEMLELSAAYPNASVEDLYLLAKAKFGDKDQKQIDKKGKTLSLGDLRKMMSEKPTQGPDNSQPRRPLTLAEAAELAAKEVFKE